MIDKADDIGHTVGEAWDEDGKRSKGKDCQVEAHQRCTSKYDAVSC